MKKSIDIATFINYTVLTNETKGGMQVKNPTSPHAPYAKLKGAIREKGLNYGMLATALGISVTSICNKINGTSDFYISEQSKLEQVFGFTPSTFDD